jgi:hypothetical protein
LDQPDSLKDLDKKLEALKDLLEVLGHGWPDQREKTRRDGDGEEGDIERPREVNLPKP